MLVILGIIVAADWAKAQCPFKLATVRGKFDMRSCLTRRQQSPRLHVMHGVVHGAEQSVFTKVAVEMQDCPMFSSRDIAEKETEGQKLTERDASIQGQRSQSMEEQQLVTVASAVAGSTQSRVQAQRGASSGIDFTQVNPIQDDDMNDGEDGGHFRRPVKKHVNEMERRIRFMLVGVEAELQRLYRQFVAELQRLYKQFVNFKERDASIQGQRSQAMEEQQLVTVASADAGSTQGKVHRCCQQPVFAKAALAEK